MIEFVNTFPLETMGILVVFGLVLYFGKLMWNVLADDEFYQDLGEDDHTD